MTFPLDFDLLMIRVCTFIQGKKQKTKKQTNKQTNKQKTKKKKKKKVQRHVYASYLTPLGFCCWVHHWGFGCGPALFRHVRPHSMSETRFFVVLLENHLKKRFGVATYFCFILKGKNKIRKKNPKCDS